MANTSAWKTVAKAPRLKNSSPDVVKMIKSRRWTGHAATMGEDRGALRC
jgi:hypothetical protein